MRDGVISGVLAFVAVLVLSAALQPPGPQSTPTPTGVLPPLKCGIPQADCEKLARAYLAQVQAKYPGRRITTIVVPDYSSFEVCFADGACEGQSSTGRGGLSAPVPGPVSEPVSAPVGP